MLAPGDPCRGRQQHGLWHGCLLVITARPMAMISQSALASRCLVDAIPKIAGLPRCAFYGIRLELHVSLVAFCERREIRTYRKRVSIESTQLGPSRASVMSVASPTALVESITRPPDLDHSVFKLERPLIREPPSSGSPAVFCVVLLRPPQCEFLHMNLF